MEKLSVDVLVVGSGPAGQKAAIQASKLKKSVAIVEKEGQLGGACLHSGTIPSKTLRAAILDLSEFYQRSFYSKDYNFRDVSIHDLAFRLKMVIETQVKIIERQFKKNHIPVLYGEAEFESDHVMGVKGSEGELLYRVKCEKIIIASGSKPRNPEGIPFDKHRVLDSTTLLNIGYLPKKLIVLGGGVIGSEYASFFAALGSEVLVMDKKGHMLPYLDKEIGMHLQDGLSNIGLKFMARKTLKEIKVHENEVEVICEDGTQVRAEALLYALGREGNIESLQIKNAGLRLNKRGYIEVNPSFETSTQGIYAVGDVIGGASLASTSMEQGRLAALSACGEKAHYFPDVYPLGIYTIPEISCCGLTEEEVRSKGYNYDVGRAYYYEMAASHIYGSNDMGVVKIIFHRETLEILGVHIIGRHASEVIHIGQVAMMSQAKLDFFIDQVFNYPTFAEGYRIAALNGLNKVRKGRA